MKPAEKGFLGHRFHLIRKKRHFSNGVNRFRGILGFFWDFLSTFGALESAKYTGDGQIVAERLKKGAKKCFIST